jgi:hypothetical protein
MRWRCVDTLRDYAQLWIDDKALNQPIRRDSTTLNVELGFYSFSEAAAAWQAIR